jgi:hypothetical protein
MLELALRPASSAQAQKPPTARQRRRRGARATGCDCGAGPLLLGPSSAARGSFASTPNRSQGLALFLRATPTEERKAEDHDEHQTRRRREQAAQAQPR